MMMVMIMMPRTYYILFVSLFAVSALYVQLQVASGVSVVVTSKPIGLLNFLTLQEHDDDFGVGRRRRMQQQAQKRIRGQANNKRQRQGRKRRNQESKNMMMTMQGGGNNNNNNNKTARRTRKPRKRRIEQLKIPTPVFVLSLPKSGTTSLYSYFNCGGVWSSHTFTRNHLGEQVRIGACLRTNFLANRPLLENCGPVTDVFTDIGYPGDEARQRRHDEDTCFYPSLQALDAIIRDYPNSTIIVSYRAGWHDSIRSFHNLRNRWRHSCNVFPNSTNATVWQDFYVQHRRRIREAVALHPTIRYLEFDLRDPTAGQQLENFTGISQECWADCKPNMRCSYNMSALSTLTTTMK